MAGNCSWEAHPGNRNKMCPGMSEAPELYSRGFLTIEQITMLPPPAVMNYIFLLLCLCGLVGNGLVLWFFGFSIKRNPFSIYFLHLASADVGYLFSKAVFSILNTGGFLGAFADYTRSVCRVLGLCTFLTGGEPPAGRQHRALRVGHLPLLVLAPAAQAPVSRGVRPAVGPVPPGHLPAQLLLRVPRPRGPWCGLQAHGHLPGHPPVPALLPAHGTALPGPHPAHGVPGPTAPALCQAQPRHPGHGLRLSGVLHLLRDRLVPLLGLPDPGPLPRVRHRPVHLHEQQRQTRRLLPGREGQVAAAVGAAQGGLPAGPEGRR
ncbi:hypothetical protein H8959_002420 [Pygathrix nigripes]